MHVYSLRIKKEYIKGTFREKESTLLYLLKKYSSNITVSNLMDLKNPNF